MDMSVILDCSITVLKTTVHEKNFFASMYRLCV